jgi:hypothetical protein
MVKVKINGVEYSVQTRWEEVDAVKIMVCENFREELEAMSDIPKEIINKAADVQLFPLQTLISFIYEVEEFPAIQAVNIAEESYEKLELAKTRIQTGKTYNKILKAAITYYPEEKNAVRLLSLGISIVNQIGIFLEKYQEMTESEHANDELAAGVEQLDAFGSWGTAFSLAGKDVLKLRGVLEMKAIVIYEALRYNFREARYTKRLFELRNPKK